MLHFSINYGFEISHFLMHNNKLWQQLQILTEVANKITILSLLSARAKCHVFFISFSMSYRHQHIQSWGCARPVRTDAIWIPSPMGLFVVTFDKNNGKPSRLVLRSGPKLRSLKRCVLVYTLYKDIIYSQTIPARHYAETYLDIFVFPIVVISSNLFFLSELYQCKLNTEIDSS